jgi:hypothetical protein
LNQNVATDLIANEVAAANDERRIACHSLTLAQRLELRFNGDTKLGMQSPTVPIPALYV